MDKGAHFQKCDFQVHTPRDIGWKGGDAVTDPERKAYAEELILACRTKGIDAIAITDHHDFVFFPYVKKAAVDELDSSGNPIPPQQRIVVFPGLELTLTAPNCQAILILDANFPENNLQSVLTALAIAPASSGDSKTAEVKRIPQNVVADLSALYESLNSQDHIRGRFIVLPNVSETGHGTMLRSGFANFYKSMPCVGGYVDGAVSKFGTGNQSIVEGRNRDYGFKPIGVFQTSDNRKRDHSDLGKHTTFAKWSEPTAEALRQACLAKESRLSQSEPELPSLWITSISVSNSKFLGRLDVEFNQQYNAVIGGRGTGKSTILEYVRWGVCDQPVDDTDSDIAPVQTKRKKLIDDTLLKFDGEVIVNFILNSVPHIVKRNSKTKEILLKIGNGEFAQATEQEIRNLFPVQAYSQKQLSSIGVRLEELKRFVEAPIKASIDQVRSEIRDTEAKIKSAYGGLIRKREIEAEIAKHNVEITSLTEQVAALRKGLKGLSDADQQTIKQKPLFDNEALIVEGLRSEFSKAEETVAALAATFDNLVDGGKSDLEIENKPFIEGIRKAYATAFTSIRTQISTLSENFKGAGTQEIDGELKKWTALKTEFDKKYGDAKGNAAANQNQLQQIEIVEARIAELNKLLMANRAALAALGDPESTHKSVRAKWDELHARKIATLDAQCQKFSELSNGIIKADLNQGLDTGILKQGLKVAFTSLNIKESKIDDLCERALVAKNPIETWNAILAELEGLAFQSATANAPLPSTPILDASGLIDSEKRRLVAGFDSARWLELSVTKLEFNPTFRYCTNAKTSEYIDFADASAGQQATALLTVLLNQPGAPLVIDQPEDDVDSKMTQDIVKQIWKAKNSRQLIFSSHNANFVVNGDAELVICCDYVKAGDQTGGQIRAVGAIDNVVIKDEITAVTEGGKDAFKLRKEKYGF